MKGAVDMIKVSNVSITKISITKLDTDVIVNAANMQLRPYGAVCEGIFKAAGYEKLSAVCQSIGHCEIGSAVVTPGFDLKSKYIIHAVGPVWHGGKFNEGKLLYSAYKQSLRLAVKIGCTSIGFPLISSGASGYPVEKAWRKALQACYDFLEDEGEIDIVFAVNSDKVLGVGGKILDELFPPLGAATKNDWKIVAMPQKHELFVLERIITQKEMDILRKGNIPESMDDKWFWYMEGNTLYAHRSWTGICIYEIIFGTDGHHFVKVNRDPDQYKCTSIEEDLETLNMLLDWWTQPQYDYYNEWLMETHNSMKKAGLIPEDEEE